MSVFKRILILLYFLSFSGVVIAQDAPFRFKMGLGLATYYGDLKEKAKLIDQSSIALNLGMTYDFTDQLMGRADISIMKLKADDRFNTRQDFINRNLNFRTNLWEFNLGIEYDFMNINSGEYFLTPYMHLGLGIFHSNPWTYSRTGEKVYLRNYGTEGQGLPSYPERKKYGLLHVQIPIGAGVKVAVTEDINLFFDITLRKLFTDYLDDVGNTYPDKAIVLTESSTANTTIGLTYRGDEISSSPYPGVNIKRGGYAKDMYYTIGLGLSFRLNSLTLGSGSGRSTRNWGTNSFNRSRLRSPRNVY
ncbi:MAG: DUF6089 family protein [Sediminibacterium sp.]|nr:DUF6089 family protein [Sediminibacterium sp.]